jgi:hypothetical protein
VHAELAGTAMDRLRERTDLRHGNGALVSLFGGIIPSCELREK